jgi:cytochrome c oxidase subunit III
MATTHAPSHHGHEPGQDEVFHQYRDLAQQNESYIVGMWTFLVTEVMFFGGLFLAYMLYRWNYQEDFYKVHRTLSIMWGGINTFVLLASSFSMAMAVYYAQVKKRKEQLMALGFTTFCAFVFLVIKLVFEWKGKFEHGVLPGPSFTYPYEGMDPVAATASPAIAQMFYSLYFAMTGLHGLHVVIGIFVIVALMFMTWKKYPQVESYIPTEMVGLYWHFVDLVWIFLYPLFYLIPE